MKVGNKNGSGYTVNIGVIGGGSIGLLISSYFSLKHTVTVYVRRELQKNKLNNEGIVRPDSRKVYHVKSLLINQMSEEDCYIVCVKQAHIPAILKELSKVNLSTPVIFLQNGMGHVDLIAAVKQPILLGVVEHGALKQDDHTVAHTGKGNIKIAAFSTSEILLNKLVMELHQTAFPVYMVSEWYRLLVEKLIINATINPITALFHMKNGEIIHNQYINTLAKKLCEEAALILELDAAEQWGRIQEVAKNTEGNTSSMLMDISQGRQTELEAITGYLIKRNRRNKIPYTLFIYNGIKALEVGMRMKVGND